MKIKLLTLFLLPFIFISCQGQSSKTVQTIDVKLFAEKLKLRIIRNYWTLELPKNIVASTLGMQLM